MTEAGGRTVGSFQGADDLLMSAQNGELARRGKIVVGRSGKIGPLVEIVLARRANPTAFTNVQFEARFARSIDQALNDGRIDGIAYRATYGVFPLLCLTADGEGADHWALWRSRAEKAAVSVGFSKLLSAAIIGAMGELQDNVFCHSGHPETGLAAYAATKNGFEIVVADSGVGPLASLRECPDYADLQDAGEALRIAAADGNSRFGSTSGRGFGVGQMFRALANYDGELRFRSDDYALSICGHSPSLQGTIELRHKARLGGMTISVFCPAPTGGGRLSR